MTKPNIPLTPDDLDPGDRLEPFVEEPETGHQHAFIASRCVQCGCDDHSVPAEGEALSDHEKPCPVPWEERVTRWSFGPEPGERPLPESLGEAPTITHDTAPRRRDETRND